MAALWDIVGKASNLAQLLGLDAVKLIAIATSFLCFHQVTKECWKLEEQVLMLRVLLRSSSACSLIIIQQQHLELWDQVTQALEDAHELVESYKESALFTRVRSARSMARQFRDLRNMIHCYYGLILSINAHLLIVQANPPPPSLVRPEVNGVVSPSTEYSIDAETSTAAPHDTHAARHQQCRYPEISRQ